MVLIENKTFILVLGILISFLNLFDGFVTNYGYVYNIIDELNPLMDTLLKWSPDLFIIFKFFISVAILLISFAVYHKSSARFQNQFLFSLVGVSILYIGISVMHIVWLSYL